MTDAHTLLDVHRPDGKSETRKHFDEQTCSGIPLSVGAARILVAITSLVGLLVAMAVIFRGRRGSGLTARAWLPRYNALRRRQIKVRLSRAR